MCTFGLFLIQIRKYYETFSFICGMPLQRDEEHVLKRRISAVATHLAVSIHVNLVIKQGAV